MSTKTKKTEDETVEIPASEIHEIFQAFTPEQRRQFLEDQAPDLIAEIEADADRRAEANLKKTDIDSLVEQLRDLESEQRKVARQMADLRQEAGNPLIPQPKKDRPHKFDMVLDRERMPKKFMELEKRNHEIEVAKSKLLETPVVVQLLNNPFDNKEFTLPVGINGKLIELQRGTSKHGEKARPVLCQFKHYMLMEPDSKGDLQAGGYKYKKLGEVDGMPKNEPYVEEVIVSGKVATEDDKRRLSSQAAARKPRNPRAIQSA